MLTLLEVLIINSAGMHLMLNTSHVCLYLASYSGVDGTANAWVLLLEPRSRDLKPAPAGKRRRRKQPPQWEDSVHPVNKLPWFKRRPLHEIRSVRVDTILMRVRVAPAFTYNADDGQISNDGYLLSHGMYNFDLRGKNEKVFVCDCE